MNRSNGPLLTFDRSAAMSASEAVADRRRPPLMRVASHRSCTMCKIAVGPTLICLTLFGHIRYKFDEYLMLLGWMTKGGRVVLALLIAISLICGGVLGLAVFASYGLAEKSRQVRAGFREWPPCPSYPDPRLNCSDTADKAKADKP